jgi:hypothetical protein
MVRKSEHCEQWTMFDADSWLCPFGAGKIFAVEKLKDQCHLSTQVGIELIVLLGLSRV